MPKYSVENTNPTKTAKTKCLSLPGKKPWPQTRLVLGIGHSVGSQAPGRKGNSTAIAKKWSSLYDPFT